MGGLDGGRRGEGGERAEYLPAIVAVVTDYLGYLAAENLPVMVAWMQASGARYTWIEVGRSAAFPSPPRDGHSIWPVAARAGMVQ